MNQQQRAVWEKVVELLVDNREYIEADERPEYLALYDKAIADANALLEQPELGQDSNVGGCAMCGAAYEDQVIKQPVQKTDRYTYIETLRKALSKLPRYSFLLGLGGVGSVRRVPDRRGAWIEWAAAHELFDADVVDSLLQATPPAQPEPVQEPVACGKCGKTIKDGKVKCALGRHCWVGQQPAQPAAWVGLTDAELEKVFPAIATYHEANKTLYRSIARSIEAKLKEKNT
jgi:hypothetical protein